IKNNNKYLQYYDKRWDSLLFINMKLYGEFTDKDIINYVENTLDKKVIKCTFIKNIIHSKYSVSHKEVREYNHYFYLVNLDNYDFLDNYKFFSIDELKNNKRIMEVNSDIVSFIEEMNL
ncbi:MAG: hypothetical protein Q4E69_05845, partial [Bacilli bacterium]|nr:hypothetical protein [Bacilli bacterium]